jgi:uncharacterized SAM-binding protein YcdF (DUF218 family)
MFGFLSKTIAFLTDPLSWVLILFVMAFLLKKPAARRRLFFAALAVLLLFSNPLLLNQFAKRWDITHRALPKTEKYSCAIVLGGFSSQLNKDSGYFNWSSDRFIEAVKLYNNGNVSHILVTGGNGTPPHQFEEADWVRTQLREFHVPDSCILTEDKSRNTLQNAAFTKPVIENSGLKPPYLLVTSGFHMRRSLGIFRREQIPVVPYSCNFVAGIGSIDAGDFLPDAGTIFGWNTYIKEVLGTIVNDIRWKLSPSKPTL